MAGAFLNIGLILAGAAGITPLAVENYGVRLERPRPIGGSLLCVALVGGDGRVDRGPTPAHRLPREPVK